MAEKSTRRRATRTGVLTLGDVARVAGVSTATTSRAINTPEVVGAENLEKVRRAIAETGYVPNLLARGLASNKTRLVAALVPGIASSIFNETIEAMTAELAAAGYLVVLGLVSDDPDEMDRTITSILERRPDGLIFTGSELTPQIRARLRAAETTVIETWDMPNDPIDVAIGFSHTAVGQAMAAAVIANGYRAPLVITADTRCALERATGFMSDFHASGRGRAMLDVSAVGAGRLNGRAVLARHLDGGGKADVVVCSSDQVAQGVLIEAAARGLRSPQDLAVIGFGGAESSAFSHPPLTTISVDGAAIGRQAARVMVERSNGQEPAEKLIDVGFQLVARESF